jgi:hypothetical protein
MNERLFRAIVAELIDENSFACRALLKIVSIKFTEQVPTLAVTTGDKPHMLVNLAFVQEHCETECHVKAVVCHEFLHVLLRHTDRVAPVTGADHLALDAVINALIHRELGAQYSDFMQKYYANEKGLRRLLRPWFDDEICEYGMHRHQQDRIWAALYQGKLVVDDIRDLAKDLTPSGRTKPPQGGWLGNHTENEDAAAGAPKEGSAGGDRHVASDLSPIVVEALNRSLKSMNGEGIWRAPKSRGVGAHAYANQVQALDDGVELWRRKAWNVLRKHLAPDPRAPRTENVLVDCRLPVLSPGDRRSFARALWSPLLPDAIWKTPRRISGGTAQVYLDVSGSMSAEMPLIVALLARLGKHIRQPLWAFSDVVAPAVIKHNRLYADTTGGTSISCVLQHVATTRPGSAVIVTDGYIETLDSRLLTKTAATRLHAIVTRDGSPHSLARAGIPYTQLGSLPQ